MESLRRRAGLRGWFAPSLDPGLRRLIVAGVAGILLTAPLSLQQLITNVRPLGYVLTVAGAALAVYCCRPAWKPSSAVTWTAILVCVVFATITVVDGVGEVATGLGKTDSQLLCADDVAPAIVAGGQAVLHGSNPYTSYNVLRAQQSLGCSTFHVTALRAGAFGSRSSEPSDAERAAAARATLDGRSSGNILLGFSWPAGSALVGTAGAHGVVVLNVLFLLVAGAVVVRSFPAPMRRWVGLALLAQAGVLVFIGQAHPDGLVAALMIVACARRNPIVGGGAIGLACAIKQTAWFIAPALLILAFRRGARAGMRQAGAMVLAFAAINAPFIAVDPSAWVNAVAAPQLSPLFPLGGGPIALFTDSGHVSLVMASFTAAMALTVLAGCLLAWRGRGGLAQAGVIVASLGLWDGPRSLLFYFGLLGVIAVSICARDLVPGADPTAERRGTAPPLRSLSAALP